MTLEESTAAYVKRKLDKIEENEKKLEIKPFKSMSRTTIDVSSRYMQPIREKFHVIEEEYTFHPQINPSNSNVESRYMEPLQRSQNLDQKAGSSTKSKTKRNPRLSGIESRYMEATESFT